MWDEITYPLPNFTVEVWEELSNHPTFYQVRDYLPILGLNLNYVS